MSFTKARKIKVKPRGDVDIVQQTDSTDIKTSALLSINKINYRGLIPVISKNYEVSSTTDNDSAITIKKTFDAPTDSRKKCYSVFQRAMKLLIITGQCFGLLPIQGVLEEDPYKVSYRWCSVKSIYSVVIFVFQLIHSLLPVTTVIHSTITFNDMASLAFDIVCTTTTLMTIRIAARWPALVREISNTPLQEYNDPKVVMKCNIVTFTLLIFATVEHVFSIISDVSATTDCYPEKEDVYLAYIENHFSYVFKLGIPKSKITGIILQLFTFVNTINWNYSDVFIVCLSYYLTSVLSGVNKKILSSRGKYYPGSFWNSLREDYTRATRLVRSVDDIISALIFISFANNLFFVCLQLFNLMTIGLQGSDVRQCPAFPSGPFNGYEFAIYRTFSLLFLLSRTLFVSLVASGVHSASQVPASALYDVPSAVYSSEVQRFLEQVHGDHVALSGLQFFYLEKGLVLTAAGTIVTYELVLLQINGTYNSQ